MATTPEPRPADAATAHGDAERVRALLQRVSALDAESAWELRLHLDSLTESEKELQVCVGALEETNRQLQERLTRQLADAIHSALQPDGVAVILSAEHMCMSLRGVKKPRSKVVTSASRGSLRTQDATRREFYALLGKG